MVRLESVGDGADVLRGAEKAERQKEHEAKAKPRHFKPREMRLSGHPSDTTGNENDARRNVLVRRAR